MKAASAVSDPDAPPAPAPAAAVRALAFDGCLGLLHPAPGDTAVLMCSPWGYEELCARRSWRRLAEAIAAAGAPCLRFDYPGTGDSLDPGRLDLDAWIDAAERAAHALRQATGARRLILLGQGLGATVAALAARRIGEAAGLVLMAPATSGRIHLRELAMWGSVVSASIRLPATDEPVGVAGFVLAPQIAAGLKTTELAEAAPAIDTLLLARPGQEADARLAVALRARGAGVERIDYEGYDALLTDPTTAVFPAAAVQAVAAWIGARATPAPQPAAPTCEPVLQGPHFTETPVRFGGEAELFGVLCRPRGARRGRTVVMLNSGYDPHAGWARAWTLQARALAERGIASLRIDAAGVGDSPARPGAPEQTLYSDAQLADARAATDWLHAEGLGPVMLVGRCSGAYLGLDAAVADPRVQALVLVNPLRLVWRPGESVDEAIRSASLSHYRARALQPQTLGRILRGEVAVGRLALRLLRRAVGGLAAREQAALRARVHAKFAALRARKAEVALVYSEADDGLIELAAWFGRDGRDLGAYPNVRRADIAGADHNLTPAAARARLLEEVSRTSLAQ